MKILGLYNNSCAIELFEWLENKGHEVILCTQELNSEWCRKQNFDLTVSYTYRYIIKAEVICALGNNVVNIHNSFLPYNRGADPNIWSMIENTPRGVTLHYINSGLDKGDIISQKIVVGNDDDSFASSYTALDVAAKELFKESFAYYNYWEGMRKQPTGEGSYHSSKDGMEIKERIDTYEMKVLDYKKKMGVN